MMNYDQFLELLRYRRSIRRFKPDPIPDDAITKILDAAHYAMSGANSQPWEFIVIKDPKVKKKIYEIYKADLELTWAMEQQRIPEYRHPAFNISPEEREKALGMLAGWKEAPVCIAVLEDPRKQWGSVMVAHGDMYYSSSRDILSASMGHLSMTIHLAAASLGLGSQRVDVNHEQAYKEALGHPEPLRLSIIVPVGYRAYEPGPPHRLSLEDLVHFDRYDMKKFLRNHDFLKYLERIRSLGRPGYRVAIGEEKG
jgi:nitroreductase